MYGYTLSGKVRTLLEWADGLLSKEYDDGWMDWVRDCYDYQSTGGTNEYVVRTYYTWSERALDNSQEEVWKED